VLLGNAVAALAGPIERLTASAGSTAITVAPDANTYVSSATPAASYGTSTRLRVGASPSVVSYLRFTVQGMPASGLTATLRLYATGSGQNVSVRPVSSNTWTEAISFSNRPAYGAPVATHGPFTANSWQTIDVSSLVTANGTYSVALTSTAAGAFASSRAAGSLSPSLVVAPASSAGTPHVMVIIEENQEYGSVIGNVAAPYLNSLAKQYTSATKWYAVQHNSPADYVALISGSTQNWGTSRPPFAGQTLVDELASQGLGWKAYMEDMPSPCYTGQTAGTYVKIHNPFVYFTSILSNPTQCNRVVPFAGNFAQDFAAGTAPPFVWVTPNNCHNMHDACAPTRNGIAQGDQWLKAQLPAVLGSSWFLNGGEVIITWDEGTSGAGWNGGSGGHIVTLVLSGQPHGNFAIGGNHYGTLRGIEETYSVGLLGSSTNAANGDLRPAF